MSKNKTTEQIIHKFSLQQHNCHNSFSPVGTTEMIIDYAELTTITAKFLTCRVTVKLQYSVLESAFELIRSYSKPYLSSKGYKTYSLKINALRKVTPFPFRKTLTWCTVITKPSFGRIKVLNIINKTFCELEQVTNLPPASDWRLVQTCTVCREKITAYYLL